MLFESVFSEWYHRRGAMGPAGQLNTGKNDIKNDNKTEELLLNQIDNL